MRHPLMPPDTPDYMLPAWYGCIHWAIGKAEIVDAFRKETGNQWLPGKTPLEKAIDAACRADDSFITAFILWANENVWGKLE